MKPYYFTVPAVLLLMAGSGCETISGQERRVAESRRQHEWAGMQMQVKRTESRLDSVETELEVLHERFAHLQETLAQRETHSLAERSALEEQLQGLAADQKRMRGELAEELSARMATLLQRQAAADASTRTQSGYEHVVRAGETLSEIARAYKVSSAVIVRANHLKNPDNLRVGQTLFIPE